MGAWSVGDINSEIDMAYYLRAKQLLEQVPLMESGNLNLVQALLLLHDFSQKRGMPDTSLQYLSVASRMAVNLGLHKEDLNPTVTLFESEMRRRVWWSLYVFDSSAAKNFGVSLSVPENSFITAKPVLNIHDEVLLVISKTSIDQRLTSSILQALDPATSTVPREMNEMTLYTGLISQAQFHVTANTIYRRLVATPNLSVHEVQELERLIDAWHDSHPAYVKGPGSPSDSEVMHFIKYRLQICDKNLRILLWKPFLFNWAQKESTGNYLSDPEKDLHKQCAFRCLYTARESLNLILQSIDRHQHTRIGSSFLLYVHQVQPILFLRLTM